MEKQHSDEFQRASYVRMLEGTQFDFTTLYSNGFGVAQQTMEVINAQNKLIKKFFEQQNILFKELNKKTTTSQSGLRMNSKRNVVKKISGYRQLNNMEHFSYSSNRSCGPNQQKTNVEIVQMPNNPRTLKKIHFALQIDSSQQSGEQNSRQWQQRDREKRKKAQSKKMGKSFGKAILRYIRKNKEKRRGVLNRLGICQQWFMEMYQHYRGRIRSITELISLWAIDGNPFNKAFRILSFDYLRKYCLEKTFKSRPSNHLIYLKYRKMLLKAAQIPLKLAELTII